MTERVPFFSGAASIERLWGEMEPLVEQVARVGEFVSGPMVAELESALAEWTGAGDVVAVGSGSDALILMLQAAGIGPGDEVIVPAYTFFATVAAVQHVGASPVLVDILPGSYAIDPAAAEAAIGPRTRAILPVHLFSQMADMIAVKKIADAHGIDVFEDSAEAIGMLIDGVHAGRWGQAGVLSFFPTKTLGALGDAGAILTDDVELSATIRAARRHSGRPSPDSRITYRSCCDDLQAAVLLARLRHLRDDIATRAKLAAHYTQRLAELAPLVRTPYVAAATRPSSVVWYVYLVECAARDRLATFLADHGVGTEIYYPRPLTRQPCLAKLPSSRRPVPVAEAASACALALPLYPDLPHDQVDLVCDLIHGFYENSFDSGAADA
jgi:UDP-2-acetamido-2-deoxy-ribo-hexuluronate aminotransferase